MKASRVQPVPAEPDVMLTMTADEARTLYTIASHDVTIPQMVSGVTIPKMVSGVVDQDKAQELLVGIRGALSVVV